MSACLCLSVYLPVPVTTIHTCLVVYEDSLTDAFFSCLVKLHTQFIGPPIILIALEKRFIIVTIMCAQTEISVSGAQL